MEGSKKRRGSVSGSRVRKSLGPFGGPPQSEKVVSATLYQQELRFARGTSALARLASVTAVDPQIFTTMTPPRTGAGTGSNTSQSLGVEQATASTAASTTDPFQRNFYGIKIDHPGFNACNPVQWNANISQFAYVKTSAVVCEILLPDPPMGTSDAVKLVRPGVISTAQLAAYQTANTGLANVGANVWDEIRPMGAWMYIVIPAQKGASISLYNTVGLVRWQQLMQLGYKPKICKGNKYRVMAMAKGFDTSGTREIYDKLGLLISNAGVAPASNGVDYQIPGSYTKNHAAQECDWSVQYAEIPLPDTFLGGQQKLTQFGAQGFDTIAFGSAIVFQFCQYAPLTGDGDQTAANQSVPVTLTIHNKTVFSQLKTASRDLGQVYTLPITVLQP